MNLAALTPAPGHSPDWPALEEAVATLVPIADLAATPQDPIFHAEGDVWTHTRMVVEALCGDPAYAAASPAVRAVLLAAALFHDVGKPATTRVDPDGRITSRGHSRRGAGLVRIGLWRAGVPFGVREHVCALIAAHQVPFFAIDRPPGEGERLATRLSLSTRNDWLGIVAAADGRGRRCADPSNQVRIVDNCALWRDLAAEHGAADRPRPFPDAHTRQVYLDDDRGTRRPDVPAHDDTVAEAVVLSGLPGSGKDAWLRRHRPDLPVVSLDDLRGRLDLDHGGPQGAVAAAARERAREHLRRGQPFAWSATNLAPSLRRTLTQLCRRYRFRTHVVYCEVGADEQARRNRERDDAQRVPAAAIERMMRRWTVPTPEEAHQITYAVDGDAPDQPAMAWPPVG